jgi:predicted kinase
VIFDATNTQFSHRHTALQLAFNHYAHTTIVYFDLPLDEILSRNRQRNRQVPEGIISRYFNDLEVPLQTEAQELRIISLATDPIWNSPQIL